MASKEFFFYIFFLQNLFSLLPWQPIKFSNLGHIIENAEDYKKLSCSTKNPNIPNETIDNFFFSHYKSMDLQSVAIATRTLIQLKQKHNYSFPLPIDMKRIGLSVSDEKFFEAIDGLTLDAC